MSNSLKIKQGPVQATNLHWRVGFFWHWISAISLLKFFQIQFARWSYGHHCRLALSILNLGMRARGKNRISISQSWRGVTVRFSAGTVVLLLDRQVCLSVPFSVCCGWGNLSWPQHWVKNGQLSRRRSPSCPWAPGVRGWCRASWGQWSGSGLCLSIRLPRPAAPFQGLHCGWEHSLLARTRQMAVHQKDYCDMLQYESPGPVLFLLWMICQNNVKHPKESRFWTTAYAWDLLTGTSARHRRLCTSQMFDSPWLCTLQWKVKCSRFHVSGGFFCILLLLIFQKNCVNRRMIEGMLRCSSVLMKTNADYFYMK